MPARLDLRPVGRAWTALGLNRQHPLTRGLVGCWPYQERGGAPRNLARANHPATPNSGRPGWAGGHAGASAGDFQTGPYWSDADLAAVLAGVAHFSTSTWVYRAATTSLVLWGFGNTANNATNFNWYSDGNFYVSINNATGNYLFTPIAGVGWHHIVVTWDGTLPATNGRVVIYLDGRVVPNSTGVGVPSATLPSAALLGPWLMGADVSLSRVTTGRLEMVTAYNRTLSPAEAWALYSDPYGMLESSLPLALRYGLIATVQVARPASDVSAGGWTTAPLYAAIDETTANDSDFITSSPTPSNDLCEVALGPLTDPQSSTGHIIHYRYAKAASPARVDLTVSLVQGTTVIATWTHTDIGTTVVQADQTLSGGQADSISSYTDLRLRFSANAP